MEILVVALCLTYPLWFAFGYRLGGAWLDRRAAKRVPIVVDYKRIPFARAVGEMARVWPWREVTVKLTERNGAVERLEARR